MKKEGFSSVLITIFSPEGEKTLQVKDPSFFVGRSPDSAVRIEDPNVSRTHLQVTCTEKHIFVTDQKSANGTYLNGSKLPEFKPVPIVQTDKILFGKTDYSLSFLLQTAPIEAEVEPQPAAAAAVTHTASTRPSVQPPAPPKSYTPERFSHRTSSAGEYQSSRFENSQPDIRQQGADRLTSAKAEEMLAAAKSQASQMLTDSRRQAAQILFEAEEKAYAASQSIYKKAEDARRQADIEAQKIVEQSRQEAEAIHAEQMRMGKELIAEAKRKAEVLREKIVEDAVEKGRIETEERISDLLSQKMNLDSQVSRLQEMLRSEAADLDDVRRHLEDARAEEVKVEENVRMLRTDTHELGVKKSELQQYIEKNQSSRQELEDQVHRLQVEKTVADEKVMAVQREIQELDEIVKRREEEVHDKRQQADRLKDDVKLMETGLEALRNQMRESEDRDRKSREEMQEFEKRKAEFLESIKGLEVKKQDMTNELNQFESQKQSLEKKLEFELKEARRRHDMDLQKVKEQSQKKMESFVADESKRIEDVRVQMINELNKVQSSLANEIHQRVWTILLQDMPSDSYKHAKKPTLHAIEETISNRLMGNVTHEITVTESLDMIKKKTAKKQLRWALSGFAVAVALAGGLFYWQEYLRSTTFASLADQARLAVEADRKARKFNPDQDIHVRESYVDSVIFTKRFVELYSDAEVHGRWVKEASDYLYRQWRIDEEKSIEVVSMAKSLVGSLNQKKDDINPDFVKENIEKMREAETETISRMKDILGTNVKYEAFKKFETKFFSNEIYRRTPAAER